MAEKAAMHLPHDGKSAGSGLATITPAGFATRLALRARPDTVAPLTKALGVSLPDTPKTSSWSKNGKRLALWLGPDEWLVIDEAGADLMTPCTKVSGLHSAVDVSHRNIALIVSGKGAEATLKAGCPQNLSLEAFPIGACSRTMLGKVEVVIVRTDAESFRVEHWRSFSDYVFGFLTEAIRDRII